MNAYWWRGYPNFGDELTETLLRHAGFEVEWANVEAAEVVVCGSILRHLPDGWGGTVLGAGHLRAKHRTDLSRARVLALRGPLSAEGVAGDFALGDPGLLAPDLVPRPPQRWGLGVVPHWSNATLRKQYEIVDPDAHIIDVTQDPLTVIAEIAACGEIVTSSLHGLVVADAYGIPVRPEPCKRTAAEGGDFKFNDYAGAIGIEHVWSIRRVVRQERVEDAQRQLREAFSELR